MEGKHHHKNHEAERVRGLQETWQRHRDARLAAQTLLLNHLEISPPDQFELKELLKSGVSETALAVLERLNSASGTSRITTSEVAQ
jgi:hypothetical protein